MSASGDSGCDPRQAQRKNQMSAAGPAHRSFRSLMPGRPVQLPTDRQCEGTVAHAVCGIDPELTGFAEKMKPQTGAHVELGQPRRDARAGLPGSSDVGE